MTKNVMQLRPKCLLIGCDPDTLPCCKRCGTDLYDPTFIQRGLLEPFFWVRYQLYRFRRCRLFPKNCAECGTRYWLGYNNHICSEECFDRWLPF